MKFHFISPLELYSPSRRWITDDIGFKVVENMYVNYPKGYNKWTEFQNRVIRKFSVDFGGIMSMDEPVISLKIGKNSLEMKVTHLPLLVEALNTKRYAKDEPGHGIIWSFGMFPRLATAWHQSTRDLVLAKAEVLAKNCDEMIEGCNRDFDDKIAQANRDRIVVLSKPRSKPKE